VRQYDVTDPKKPKLAGSVRVGGIARQAYAGGPQMVEISRDMLRDIVQESTGKSLSLSDKELSDRRFPPKRNDGE
jgi:hypothetical protein